MTEMPAVNPPHRDPALPGVEGSGQIFSRRTRFFLWSIIPMTLSLTLGAALLAPVGESGSLHGNNSYSVSAVGYSALVEMLEALGTPVFQSQHVSGRRAGPHRPLVLLEPNPDSEGPASLDSLLRDARDHEAPRIVVLPKWWTRPASTKREWIAKRALLPEQYAASVLNQCLDPATTSPLLVRTTLSDTTRWHSGLVGHHRPSLGSVQLLSPDLEGIKKVLWCDQGVFAGVVETRNILMISDPDLLNNWGLPRGDNGLLAYHLLVGLFSANGLVVDETVHGFSRSPSIWRDFLRFPLVFFSAHLALVWLLVLWSGLSRFGPPVPESPRYRPGAVALIDGMVRLFSGARNQKTTLYRYWRMTVRRSSDQLNVIPAPGDAPLSTRQAQRLASISKRRGVTRDLDALTSTVETLRRDGCDRPRMVAVARSLFLWRKELIDESRPNR